MNSSEGLLILKLILIGAGGTGKTSLAHRYLTGLFNHSKLTLGVNFFVKELLVTLNNGEKYRVKLQIWDFAGEKRFRFLLPSYSKGADGCLLLFDITDKNTVQDIKVWIDLVRQGAGKMLPMLLVAAKSDLEEFRQVSREEGVEIARSNNFDGFVETSSKTGLNVNLTFEAITKLMLSSVLK
ncbi:MAG: Rab family GTPase [Promethearchaeota archaeon]